MTATTPSLHPLVAVHGMFVRGLDRATGRLLWEHDVRSVIARLALLNGRVYALDDFCRLHCIDAATGDVLGVAPIDREVRSACALIADGEMLYVATTKSIVAVDAQGKVAWRTEVGSAVSARAGLALPGNVVQPDFTGQ